VRIEHIHLTFSVSNNLTQCLHGVQKEKRDV
jgi:hypothetical protein